ncbi:hypothetical protein VZH09_13840 (plasmid) [Synechococcus elongatus IITB7]|uniref:hypothetical protein n=1 Tax=Synechococcus elongatus TaxID=32046 RepID=UPI0030CBA5A7
MVAFAWKSAQVHGFAYAPSSRIGEPVACRLLNTQMIRDFERQVARAFPSIATDQRAWASYKVLLEISEQMLCPRFLDQITSQQTHYFRQVNSDLVLRHLEQLLTYTGTPSPGLGPD